LSRNEKQHHAILCLTLDSFQAAYLSQDCGASGCPSRSCRMLFPLHVWLITLCSFLLPQCIEDYIEDYPSILFSSRRTDQGSLSEQRRTELSPRSKNPWSAVLPTPVRSQSGCCHGTRYRGRSRRACAVDKLGPRLGLAPARRSSRGSKCLAAHVPRSRHLI
jgi:hypothetical protein